MFAVRANDLSLSCRDAWLLLSGVSYGKQIREWDVSLVMTRSSGGPRVRTFTMAHIARKDPWSSARQKYTHCLLGSQYPDPRDVNPAAVRARGPMCFPGIANRNAFTVDLVGNLDFTRIIHQSPRTGIAKKSIQRRLRSRDASQERMQVNPSLPLRVML